jgi:hypothetical protein
MKYFENFPIIEYDGKKVRDITRRNTLMRNIQTNPLVFLPYTVREGEKAEDIANFYYGSTDYTWLIILWIHIINGLNLSLNCRIISSINMQKKVEEKVLM